MPLAHRPYFDQGILVLPGLHGDSDAEDYPRGERGGRGRFHHGLLRSGEGAARRPLLDCLRFCWSPTASAAASAAAAAAAAFCSSHTAVPDAP